MTRNIPSEESAILVSINEVAKMTSMSRSMINNYREEGRFPQPVELGERRVAFVKSEVVEWINAKIAARRVPLADPGVKQLKSKIAQAYQVIGILLLGPEGKSLDVALPEGRRALNYFGSDGYTPQFLPFAHPSARAKKTQP